MAAKGKPEKSIQEKLKSFFKGGIAKGSVSLPQDAEYVLDPEMLNFLEPEQEIGIRIKAMNDLIPIVKSRRLQEHAVELLWIKVQDLASGNEKIEATKKSLEFLVAVIQGQYDQLYIMRAQFFRLIKTSPEKQENLLNQKILMLDALTQKGREIVHFEDEIGPLTQKLWVPICAGSGQEVTQIYMQIVLNLLKFNSAYMDTDVVCSTILALTKICQHGRKEEMKLCLNILDAIICYNHIPKEGLSTFICLLCRIVNLEEHCSEAWKIAYNLMGTHLGHSALYCLCQILQTYDFKKDVALIRGAVFHVGMALWGAQRVKTLDTYSAMTIMPTFQSALQCRHQLVLYEVILQTERLVAKHSAKMKAPGYDAVVGLIERILLLIPEVVQDSRLKPEILNHLHNIVSIFEKLSINDRYMGSKHKLFDLIDLCADQRPEESVINLITYRINDIYTTKPGWIKAVSELLKKYYLIEKRPSVRCKALQCLLQIYKSNKQIHEEEIIKTLILPTVSKIDEEPQLSVKLEAIKTVTAICIECSSKKSIDLLDLLEKLIMKPIEAKNDNKNGQFEDINLAIKGLIDIFCARLCLFPASITIRAYHILVKHLEMAYNNEDVFGHLGSTRSSIFGLIMKMRANAKFHLGVESDRGATVHFSPYLICRSPLKEPSNPTTNIGKNVAYISLSKACLMVIKCLHSEKDYNVLTQVLEDVPLVLQNKAVFVLYGHNIKDFINPLIDLTNQTHLDSMFNLPISESRKFSRGDFLNKVYPVIAAIAPYSEYIEKSFSQSKITRAIVSTLLNGLSWKESSRTCIVALTACALEMPKTMYTMIEKVLLDFSKISATKHVAVPMLEFLSTLIRLPEVFCSFIDKSYFTVFAVTLPFTNPFKFDPYTVSLAHHVIIMWFLKCRLAFRPNFVSFIVNGLDNNILKSFEEGGFRRGSNAAILPALAAQKVRPKSGTSADAGRLRSNSLSEHSPEKAKMRHMTGNFLTQPLTAEEANLEKIKTFNSELSDTCVDILATYMFANVAVKPKRMPTASFLLKNGQTASWIIGTKIVTITTSICDLTSSRGSPLCDRCHLLCRQMKGDVGNIAGDGRHRSSETPGTTENTDESIRRRHMSDAVVGSPSKQPLPPLNTSRRGSIEQRPDASSQKDLSKLESLLDSNKVKNKSSKQELCSCWCNGWAEIHVRRPSGEVSWITRIQNASLTSESHAEFPLSDLTTLFHPDKEDLESETLESLDNEKSETYSIFARNRRGSSESSSTPSSPSKEVKSEFFETISPKTKSPASCKTPTPALENVKKSYDAIPEVDDEEDLKQSQHGPIHRRKSLQSSSGQELHLVLKNQEFANLATPPRTPLTKEPKNPRFKAEVLQAGSYGSAGGLRDRAHTISGPSPRRPNLRMNTNNNSSVSSSGSFSSKAMMNYDQNQKMEQRVTGISPQFVFLTMYHSRCFGNIPVSEKPILINNSNKSIESSIKVLDRTYPHETHKIGVLYVGPSQSADETAILANPFGSLRYADFLHGLGSLISLRDVDRQTTFVGGLDTEDGDGDYAYMWEDDVMQVIFHVATLMPNHPKTDPKCNKKKRHIGNDFVCIVYNNAGDNKEYKLGTVKGQFIYACVIITPLDQGSNRVEIQCLPLLEEPLEHIKDAKIVSDRNLAVLVRQVALHCNLAAQIQRSVSSGREPYASNWLERLRAIKRIREKVINEQEGSEASGAQNATNDFTAAVLRK